MALPLLPGKIVTKDRLEWRTAYLRSYSLRDPLASAIEGTQPFNDASSLADQLAILSANAQVNGRKIPLAETFGDDLDQRAAELGLPARFPEVGAIGYVTVRTSSTGTTIFSGDELTDSVTGSRYQCILTGLYADQSPVPIAGISTGPSTNQAPGTILVWSAPRPGCAPKALVTQQTDGTGLTGGRLAESDDELRQRISDALANPAAAGNDAAYQKAIETSVGHGVAVQKSFTFPAILGPGTIGAAFTLRVTAPGATRIPTTLQMAQVRDYVIGQLPADDQYIEIALIQQLVDLVFDVTWATGAAGWVDVIQWPPRYATTAGAIIVSTVTSAVAFTLASDNAVYSGVPSPAAGNTLGFFNRSTGKFSRKRILSVTGTGPWAIVCDTSNAASDTGYIPVLGQRACPWSDSLDAIVATIVNYFNGIGPGEMFAPGAFFDPGVRQRRSPPAPKTWPFSISNRLAGSLLQVTSVQDIVMREGLGVTATVGSPGATASLIELGFIAAFPE